MNPYKIGDPVVDLAQGRPMVVLEAPDQTVSEWSEQNNYNLTENYANGKLGATEDEYVVRTAYVSDLRSEPSKDYTFPVSRVALIDAHHADDGRRIYDRIAVDVLESVFDSMYRNESIPDAQVEPTAKHIGGIDPDVISEALELADVQARFDIEVADDAE